MENLEETYVPSINSYLSHAMECIGGICAVSRPSTSKLETSIGDEIQKVWDLKGRVSDIEGQGKDAFSSMDSEFGNLAQSIIAAIERCNNGQCSVANYTPGSFSQVATETGLRDNYLAAMKNQSENAQLVHDAYDQAYSNIQLRIDDAEKEAAEKKKKWVTVGTVAQFFSVLAGAAAFIATLPVSGIASALVCVTAGAGVLGGLANLDRREKQLNKMEEGDYGADFDKVSTKGLSSAKGIAKNIDKYEKADGSQGSERTVGKVSSGVGIVTTIIKEEVLDRVWDHMKDKVDDDGFDATIDVTNKLVDKGIDTYADYALKGKVSITASGTVGLVSDCTMIVADYEVEKYDKQIEELGNQREEVAELQEANDRPRTYATSVDW